MVKIRLDRGEKPVIDIELLQVRAARGKKRGGDLDEFVGGEQTGAFWVVAEAEARPRRVVGDVELREEVVHVGDDRDALDAGQDGEFEAELFDLVVDEVERGDVGERDVGAEDGDVEDEVGEGGERGSRKAGREGVAEREAAEARGAADGEVARAGEGEVLEDGRVAEDERAGEGADEREGAQAGRAGARKDGREDLDDPARAVLGPLGGVDDGEARPAREVLAARAGEDVEHGAVRGGPRAARGAVVENAGARAGAGPALDADRDVKVDRGAALDAAAGDAIRGRKGGLRA